jgi:hypothetical protein
MPDPQATLIARLAEKVAALEVALAALTDSDAVASAARISIYDDVSPSI